MGQIIPPALSLYIHFPWCVSKCPYCDFNSHALRGQLDQDKYVDSLLQDLQNDLPLVWGRPVHSIFFGGGTPSLFSAKAMGRLLSGIRSLVQLKPDAEVTMELNPGSGEFDNFSEYLQAGINRLSMGFQSLDDQSLKSLGRIHNSRQAIKAYQTARESGFGNINLDMMFALPEQSRAQALEDLEKLIELNPNHISYYQLTIEANTLFAVKTPKGLPRNSIIDDYYIQGRDILESNGYKQYEVSAYAKKGFQCAHNLNYWNFGDYLGIGAGAHSKISLGSESKIIRMVKHKHPKKYLACDNNYIAEKKELNPADLKFEFMLNAVRSKSAINKLDYESLTGLSFHDLLETLSDSTSKELYTFNNDSLKLTNDGFLLSDEILKKLL